MGFFDALRPSAIAAAMKGPPKPKRHGKKGPPAAEVLQAPSSHQQLVQYLAEDPVHGKWFNAMRAADNGNTSNMIDVFSDSLDRDPRLRGLTAKRTTSMMGRPIVFRPQKGLENDEEARRAAALCQRLLMVESKRFRSRLSHLMTAAVNGYAVSPLQWTHNGKEYVPHLRFAHSNLFGYDRSTLELGFYDGAIKGSHNIVPLSNYPDSFIAHEPMAGRSDYPWRRGAMRSCIVPSFIKRNGLAFWLVAAERFGMPQVYATVPDGMDDDGESSDSTLGVVKAALASLSRYWYAVFGEGIDIHKLEGSGELDPEMHAKLIEWANTEMAIALLGQNLTTEVSGGSFAASETHRWVADDIHLADAVELAETITQQLCAPIIKYNMPGAPVPICEINTGRKQVITAEMVVQGIFSDNEMRNSMGHEAKPAKDGGDGYRNPPAGRVSIEGAPTGPKPQNPQNDGNEIDGPGDAKQAA